MGVDHGLDVREAIVQHLRADAGVAALVGAGVTGPQVVKDMPWPFIRCGLPVTAPFEASGWDGSDHSVTLHAFAHGPGEDACAKIAEAVVDALEDASLPLPSGFVLSSCDWRGTTVIFDRDEPNAYHAIINFDVTTAEAA